jgi:hypothetical protein
VLSEPIAIVGESLIGRTAQKRAKRYQDPGIEPSPRINLSLAHRRVNSRAAWGMLMLPSSTLPVALTGVQHIKRPK